MINFHYGVFIASKLALFGPKNQKMLNLTQRMQTFKTFKPTFSREKKTSRAVCNVTHLIK